MSYYILTESDNLENIVIGSKLKSDDVYSKYYMYYLINNELREIYIRTPKLRLIYPLNNLKYSQISLLLYPECDINTEFIDFITKIETYVKELFSKKKEFISVLQCKNKMTYLKTTLNNAVKITSNTNTPTKLEDFKVNSQIELIIKISYVWMNNEKFGISSLIYQIGYHGTLEQLNLDLLNINVIKPTQKTNSVIITENKQVKQSLIPSEHDLAHMINKLKKTKK